MDALHGWESRNLDFVNFRKWARRGLSLERFRADQIRKARKRFAERGGECIEWLMLQRVWGYKEKIFDKNRTKQNWPVDEACAVACYSRLERTKVDSCQSSGPKESEQDSLMTKRSGHTRWWELCKEWKSFVDTAGGTL